MFRIGIIGTENSHAMTFAKLINLPDATTGVRAWPDAQVIMVYGPQADTAQLVMREAEVSRCAERPEDFLGNVDAMMITSRRGSVHYQYALPFADAGIPLFVDKPFASDSAEAQALIELAGKRGTPLMGGSGCKYAQDVLDLGSTAWEWIAKEDLLSGSINFSADLGSEYDGFFFYSSHLVEMALAIFGPVMEEVQADEKRGSVFVRAGYPGFNAALHFTRGSHDCGCSLYGKQRNEHRVIDISKISMREVAHFVEMLRGQAAPQSLEALALPVRIIEAILRSLRTGRTERI